MELYAQARIALSMSLHVGVVVAMMLTVTAGWVHAQSKPAAQTITVYQDPG